MYGNITLSFPFGVYFEYSFSEVLPSGKGRRVAYLEGKSNCPDDGTESFKSSLVYHYISRVSKYI